MSAKYTIGIDFGTLSGRAVLVEVASGREVADCVMDYPHAVIDSVLPGTDLVLPPDFALQHPQDYLDVLATVIPGVLVKAGIDKHDVIAVGIDFTSCTLISTLADGTPLCFLDEYKANPHAYVKLWKHHAAQPYANRLNAIAAERGEAFLSRYGGKISSEWFFPKVWELLDCAPELYDRAACLMESGDWLTWQLCGVRTHGYTSTGYKAIYDKDHGFPDIDFFTALDPRLANVFDKFNAPIVEAGTRVGVVTEEAAERFGLAAGTIVAGATTDGHVAGPALGCCHAGDLFAVLGTSACFNLLGEEERYVPGICGAVRDGMIPGFYGYEAGLCCMGDHFAWLTAQAPAEFVEEAKARNLPVIKIFIERAAKLCPGESGLIALNWWNGNRNILVDSELSGMFLGMNLRTRPEELMRALIEATAYGTRMIIENFEEHGVPVKRFIACGGIARKDPFTMQLYADVLGLDIMIAGSTQSPALGTAIFAAVAAGSENGGYDTLLEASDAMKNVSDIVYHPNPEAKAVYDKLFAEYKQLHDYFGRGGNDVMKRLRAIRAEAMGEFNEEERS
ncbi:MAG: ribulokinase [Clostridia bacterium]|nr:ribulokinase [Clostridia bacterium]